MDYDCFGSHGYMIVILNSYELRFKDG